MVNKGVELTLQANWLKNPNFAWSTNFNISKIQNKVTDLNGFGESFSAAALGRAQKIGVSTSAIWGAPFAGIDQATGRELFFQNGQLYDAASYDTLFTAADAQIIGDSAPDFFGGIQNSFTFFKKLNLGIRASYRYGDSFTIDDELVSQYRVIVNRNLSVNAIDHWRQQGDITQNPRVSDNNPIISNSSRFLYDASHIKIQNVNLSYVVAMDKMNVKWIKTINFFMDVTNVFYFYKTKSPAGLNGVAEFRFKYPEARTLTFGFQANF
jgi:TonB-dependent starch-binding outer membrane protein SusC